MSSGAWFWDSGLEHHTQASGQPLKKTVVRMPGPSSMLYRWMLKTVPVTGATAHSDSLLTYPRKNNGAPPPRRRSRKGG